MVGNIVANNLNFDGASAGRPDDFNHARGTPMFVTRLSRLNDIKDWTMAEAPAQVGMDTTLIGVDPQLGPLGFHGHAVGYLELPTFVPSTTGGVYRQYTPAADARTAVPPTDQRGFVRPSLATATLGAVDPDATKPPAPNIFFEAEAASPTSPLQIRSDVLASNGAFVEVASGNNSNANPPSSGVMTFSFTVPEAGRYRVLGRVIAPTSADDSFWVRMDNGPWIQWNGIPLGTNWHWAPVHNSAQANAVVFFDLDTDVAHTLEIAYREDGTRLDRVVITADPTFTPAP
jgi:hypothetical protein